MYSLHALIFPPVSEYVTVIKIVPKIFELDILKEMLATLRPFLSLCGIIYFTMIERHVIYK